MKCNIIFLLSSFIEPKTQLFSATGTRAAFYYAVSAEFNDIHSHHRYPYGALLLEIESWNCKQTDKLAGKQVVS